jgi:hypothetical protein
MNALLRADVQARMKMLDTLLKHRLLGRNEARKLEGFPQRPEFDVELAPAKTRAALNARWRAWEGAAAARADSHAAARTAETDTARVAGWARRLATRSARAEARFVATLGPAPAADDLGSWYQAWARRTARDLALPEEAVSALAESRAQGVLDAAASEDWDATTWAQTWSRGLGAELARMALEGVSWLR